MRVLQHVLGFPAELDATAVARTFSIYTRVRASVYTSTSLVEQYQYSNEQRAKKINEEGFKKKDQETNQLKKTLDTVSRIYKPFPREYAPYVRLGAPYVLTRKSRILSATIRFGVASGQPRPTSG